MKQKPLSVIKERLGITGDDYDHLLTGYMAEVHARMLAFCHLHTLPEELFYPLCAMTADLFRKNHPEADETAGQISELKVGDAEVQLKNSGDTFEEMAGDYLGDLIRFRRLPW